MASWNAASLYEYAQGDERQPSDQELHDVLSELYDEWVPEHVADVSTLHVWACERFGSSFDTINPETLKRGSDRRMLQLKTLFTLVVQRPRLSDDALVRERICRIAKVMKEARNSLEASAILYYQLDNVKEQQIPDLWNRESFFKHLSTDEKTTTFQKLLFAVLKRIAADGLRRHDDMCYEEIKVAGEPTHAWRKVKTIKEYIFDRIQKETDYEEWKCLTNPHDNCDKVVQHLKEANHMEFPTLVMNRYIWAYNNGLYNVLTDMFFPFAACHLATLAEVTVESVERLANRHVLDRDVDDPSTLDASNAVQHKGVSVWNVRPDGTLTPNTCFKIGATFYNNYCGRDAWPKLAKDIQTYRRGLRFGHITDVRHDSVRALPPVQLGKPPDDAIASVHDGVRVWNVLASGELTLDTIFGVGAQYYDNKNGATVWKTPKGEPYVVEAPTSADVAVKHLSTDFRFRITPEAEAAFDPRAIKLPEMQRIMDVQELDADSQEWLVLMICRLFFPVGYDRWQVVLFIKGIAGSGKSTLAQIVRSFYPPTCISTLSSNIEAKFGLSAIYKGLVCVCAEVREDFGLDQAEWQSAASGEEVQIAVKGKTAFSHKWDTPFFWLGNELPKYRNASGSVSRRFFMVEFRKKVHASDPHLFEKFMKNIDLFQRKGVALYHEALRKHGEKDIWAKDVVGKQLKMWFDRVKESTDALHAFMSSDKFKFGPDLYMPMEDLRKEYFEYRRNSGHDKVKWSYDHYDSVFQELGCNEKTAKKRYPAGSSTGEVMKKWVIGIDIRDEADDESSSYVVPS